MLRGVQVEHFWKNDFEIIHNSEAPYLRSTFWSGFEVRDPYG